LTDGLDSTQLADIEKMLGSPMALPSEFTTWWVEWLAGQLQPQVLALGGAERIFFRAAPTIGTEESTSSGSFVNLATTGPVLSGLSNGRWFFMWGFNLEAVTGTPIGVMGLDVNGGGADANHVARAFGQVEGDFIPACYGRLLSILGNDSNTVTAKYAALAGTPYFRHRWLVGLRVGNV
jgi:hypothetical protein